MEPLVFILVLGVVRTYLNLFQVRVSYFFIIKTQLLEAIPLIIDIWTI